MAQKRKHRHMTKADIMASMRNTKKQIDGCSKAPFTGLATITMWIFHTEEHWSVERLIQYNERMKEYYELIEEYGEEEKNLLVERYNREFPNINDQAHYSEYEVTIDKNKKDWMFQKASVLIDNLILEEADKYLICHLNTMLDMDINKKRVQCNRKRIQEFIDNELDTSILWYRRKLFEETGIAILMPNQTEEDLLKEFECDG